MSLSNLTREEYATQDSILQFISYNYVSISKFDEKVYNYHLNYVIDTILTKMKSQDEFFSLLFQKKHVSGSYWDKLKVGKPKEFDLNFILKLPSPVINNVKIKDCPGAPSFVTLHVADGTEELKAKSSSYGKFHSWLDTNNHIIADNVRFWMESVVKKALNSCVATAIDTYVIKGENHTYKLVSRKSGPAITLEVDVISCVDCKFDIDIVAAFEFTEREWPRHTRKCPEKAPSKSWQVVPKPLKKSKNCGSVPLPILWRMSMHDQESFLLHNTCHLKAVMKLMKKLRDTKQYQRTLPSYAIKTVFLWEYDRNVRDESFWQQSLTFLFLHMLQVLIKRLEQRKIPFFWDERHNLLGSLEEVQQQQLHSLFQKSWNRISVGLQSTHDPFAIARELLNDGEFVRFKTKFNLPGRN